MKVNTLIVGLGKIGMGYDLDLNPDDHILSHARAFSLHAAFQLVGGVDPADSMRCRWEQEYRCKAYTDITTALKCVQPELVVIAVPTEAHAEVLQSVLEHSKPLAILCEKPLSFDIDEARSIVRTCYDRGVRLFVNYMRRSDPGVTEIKRRFTSGEIVTPIKGVVWYTKGFLHNGSHFFNLLEYWLGEVTDSHICATGRLWDKDDPEPDVRVSFQRGTIVFLAGREEKFSHYTVELLAQNGRLRYEQGGRRIEWQPVHADTKLKDYHVLSPGIEVIPSGMDRYQWHVAEQLAESLSGRPAQLCCGAEAFRTLESILHIIKH